MSAVATSLVDVMTLPDPEARPSSDQVCRHPFFQGEAGYESSLQVSLQVGVPRSELTQCFLYQVNIDVTYLDFTSRLVY